MHSHKCTSCDKSFVLETDLNSHITLAHAHASCKCEFCGKSFSKWGLKTHIQFSHKHNIRPEDNAIHKCEFCEETFSQAGNLTKHISIGKLGFFSYFTLKQN